ncbi:MAG: copper resistance protein CopZ [Firmicutes bacterium HGW-Firmicutes-1]|jgi:copper chaperone CopZ|nr:MAG: copper resistance protein CopZ [Firmicutes bacterium HGW-Firmicutes-1]
MKTQTIILKQVNMLCHRCVMNVISTLSQVQGIKELNVDLETHYIKFKYINSSFTRGMVKRLIKESIEGVQVGDI